jgi:hypothetical protein
MGMTPYHFSSAHVKNVVTGTIHNCLLSILALATRLQYVGFHIKHKGSEKKALSWKVKIDGAKRNRVRRFAGGDVCGDNLSLAFRRTVRYFSWYIATIRLGTLVFSEHGCILVV